MPNASVAAGDVTSDVSPADFNWDAFRAACRLRGAATVPDCATLTGIPVRTLYAMRRRPSSANVGNAIQIRAATDLSLDDLFPIAPAHQMSEAA